MQKEQLLSRGLDMMYLAACSLGDCLPDRERLLGMDLDYIYRLSKFHSVQGVLFLLIKRCVEAYGADVIDPALYERWRRSYAHEVRRLVMLDLERERLTAYLDGKGCRYVCLKGVVLHHYYAHIGMRQMADNDILIDPRYAADARDYMVGAGFDIYSYGLGNHDVYRKADVYFELHRAVASQGGDAHVYRYYKNIEQKFIATGKGAECCLSKEDFYLYFICHAYKHYSGSGYGVRFLLDTYVYTRAEWEGMDKKYMTGELAQLRLSDFERTVRALSCKLLCDPLAKEAPTLDERERELLLYCLSAGTFGTYKTHVENALRRMSDGKRVTGLMRLRYLLRRAFPPFSYYRGMSPKWSRWIVTIPVLWGIRMFRAMARSHNFAEELSQVRRAK
jgi:hypothetical protein